MNIKRGSSPKELVMIQGFEDSRENLKTTKILRLSKTQGIRPKASLATGTMNQDSKKREVLLEIFLGPRKA